MNSARVIAAVFVRSTLAPAVQHRIPAAYSSSIYRTVTQRFLTSTCLRFAQPKQSTENVESERNATAEVGAVGPDAAEPVPAAEPEGIVLEVPKVRRSVRGTPYVEYPVEVSMRYMKSDAYKQVYGELPVWKPYRRNLIGQFPAKTRKRCVRGGEIATGSACPICRDSYLVVHHRNVDLLQQFIDANSGRVLDSKKTNVCQHVQYRLEVEAEKAYELGYLEMPLSHSTFHYADYFAELRQRPHETAEHCKSHTLTDLELLKC